MVAIEVAGPLSEWLPDGLIVLDDQAVVRAVNVRAEEIVGIPRARLLDGDVRVVLPLHRTDGVSWWELTDPWHGLNTRSGHREKLLLVPGGPEVLVTARYLRPQRGAPVHRVLVSLRDAQARRRAEADHAELISLVAHELRSPLVSVKGFSATLLRRWDRFTDDQKQMMIETIGSEADRLTRLIGDLLDVSRIDTGQVIIHQQPVEIAEVCRRHVDRFTAAGGPPDSVRCQVPEGLPPAWADPDKLDQIVANLLDNALTHGRAPVTVSARFVPGTENAPEAVAVTVADEGSGIAPAIRELVFSRYWQGGSPGTIGLGLYVVRGLVRAHGGSVTISGDPGHGAEVTFTLPRPSAADDLEG